MVKCATLNKSIFKQNWDLNSYGLLLGHRNDNKYNIFLPLECPHDSSIRLTEDINLLNVINAKWISKHFVNIYRMLPGNVSVIGCYCLCGYQSFIDSSINAAEILNSLWAKENKLSCSLFDHEDCYRIFLLIDPITYKVSCKDINFQDLKPLFRNVEVQYADVLSEYVKVQSSIAVRIDTILPSERNKDLILKQLKDSVNPFIRDLVSNSMMLVNGCQMDSNMLLGLKKYDGDILNEQKNSSKLDLIFIGMQPMFDSCSEYVIDAKFEIINRVKIQGRIPSVALLPLNSTVKDAEIALKKDLVRSIYSRLELLTEELHITGGEMEVSHILLPQRVKVSLPTCSNFELYDYKFLSETANDIISRVRYFCRPPGITNEQLDINCIDVGIEKSEQTSLDDDLSEVELFEENDIIADHNNRNKAMAYFIGLSLLVFCVSVYVYCVLN